MCFLWVFKKQFQKIEKMEVAKDLIKNSGRINQQSLRSSHFNLLLKVIIKICSLKKCISKLLFQKPHFKIALSKNAFQNCSFKIAITKIIFISASINAIKGKTGGDKSLIMHD